MSGDRFSRRLDGDDYTPTGIRRMGTVDDWMRAVALLRAASEGLTELGEETGDVRFLPIAEGSARLAEIAHKRIDDLRVLRGGR